MPADRQPLHAVDDASQEPIDPHDPDALRALAPDVGLTEHVLITVAARKPARTEFFRVHPDPAFSIDWRVLEREGDSGREIYWVAPAFASAAPTEIRPVRLFTCMSKRGTTFLWPARLPSADSSTARRWHESALAIAEYAKGSWVKMIGNRDAGAYEMHRAKGDLGQPQWLDTTLRELLKLAFGNGRTIDRADHPLLQELDGEI